MKKGKVLFLAFALLILLTGCFTTGTIPHPLLPQPYKMSEEVRTSGLSHLSQRKWDVFSFIAMGTLPFAMFGGVCIILLAQKLKKKNSYR